jgi:hypothetical protein
MNWSDSNGSYLLIDQSWYQSLYESANFDEHSANWPTLTLFGTVDPHRLTGTTGGHGPFDATSLLQDSWKGRAAHDTSGPAITFSNQSQRAGTVKMAEVHVIAAIWFWTGGWIEWFCLSHSSALTANQSGSKSPVPFRRALVYIEIGACVLGPAGSHLPHTRTPIKGGHRHLSFYLPHPLLPSKLSSTHFLKNQHLSAFPHSYPW